MQHGAQKLFGVLGFERVELFSLMGLAGVIELVGGLLIVIGLLTRFTAVIAAAEMLVAYIMTHTSNGFFPILNGGEQALSFLAAFLVMVAFGGRKWSFDNMTGRKDKQTKIQHHVHKEIEQPKKEKPEEKEVKPSPTH